MPLSVAGARFVGTVEAIEDMRHILRRDDTHTAVACRNMGGFGRYGRWQSHRDPASVFAVDHAIVKFMLAFLYLRHIEAVPRWMPPA